MSHVEQRLIPRAPLGRKAVLVNNQNVRELATLKDISSVGAGVLMPEPKNSGEEFTLLFKLPTSTGLVNCMMKAKVVHCRLQGELYYVGVMLSEMESDIKKQIDTYVAYKLK